MTQRASFRERPLRSELAKAVTASFHDLKERRRGETIYGYALHFDEAMRRITPAANTEECWKQSANRSKADANSLRWDTSQWSDLGVGAEYFVSVQALLDEVREPGDLSDAQWANYVWGLHRVAGEVLQVRDWEGLFGKSNRHRLAVLISVAGQPRAALLSWAKLLNPDRTYWRLKDQLAGLSIKAADAWAERIDHNASHLCSVRQGDRLVSFGCDGVAVWEFPKKKPVFKIGSSRNENFWLGAASADGLTLAVVWERYNRQAGLGIRCFDLARKGAAIDLAPSFGPEEVEFTSLTLSPEGDILAATAWDKVLRIWDVREGRLLGEHANACNTGPVVFSPDGGKLLVGDHPKAVIWDTKKWRPQRKLRTQGNVLAWSPDGQQIAAASGRLFHPNAIEVIGAVASKRVQLLEGHLDEIDQLAFSPDSCRLASVSRDETVRVWDIAAGRQIAMFDASTAVAFIGGPDKIAVPHRGLGGPAIGLFKIAEAEASGARVLPLGSKKREETLDMLEASNVEDLAKAERQAASTRVPQAKATGGAKKRTFAMEARRPYFIPTVDHAERMFEALNTDDVKALRKVVEEVPNVLKWERGDLTLPMQLAAERDARTCAAYLLSIGQDVEGFDPWSPELPSALHCAARGGHVKMLKFLIEKGHRIDGGYRIYGTPVAYAVDANQPKAVRWLIDNGANLRLASAEGQTPLTVAIDNGYGKIVDLLKQAGAPEKGIAGKKAPQRTYSKLDLRKDVQPIVRSLTKGAARFAKENPDALVSCIAVHFCGRTGKVALCLETGVFDGVVPLMSDFHYEVLDRPAWRKAYERYTRMDVTTHTGRAERINYPATGHFLHRPYMKLIQHAITQARKAHAFDPLNTTDDCKLGAISIDDTRKDFRPLGKNR